MMTRLEISGFFYFNSLFIIKERFIYVINKWIKW
jgi:hypothetical protein